MKRLKSSLTVRGDSLYCPLPLSLDSYGNCLVDCHHCYFRNLNHVWGQDLKPVDLDGLDRKLSNGPKNKNPQTPLAHMLQRKKTIRFGNKADPFQPAEKIHRVSRQVINLLTKHEWSFVIQTRFTDNMMECEKNIMRAHEKKLVTIMPVMSPGLDKDWELLERKRTTPPWERIKYLRDLKNKGVNVGVNGEPFIPGFHTVKDFENALKLLKEYEMNRYNVYNFHFNAFVAKRLHAIGIDIEKIWYHNQDKQWKPILRKLLDLGKKYNIILGCPDFVNSGKDHKERANTCCGVDVPNPTTFNTHYFKKLRQEGKTPAEIINETYDGAGDLETGESIVWGDSNCNFYTLGDAGFDKK